LAARCPSAPPRPALPGAALADEAGEQPSFVEVDEAPPRLAHPDAREIELRTSGAQGGPWPVLVWEPIGRAETDGVTLYAASGDVYWRWRGEDAQVRVGGFPEEPDPDAALRCNPHPAGDVVSSAGAPCAPVTGTGWSSGATPRGA